MIFQIGNEKLSQEILMDWDDSVLREPLLKHVEIQYIITNTSTKGKVLGSQQGLSKEIGMSENWEFAMV